MNLSFLKIWISEKVKCLKCLTCVFLFLVCFGLCIDVLSVSMGFNVIFCIFQHTLTNKFDLFESFECFEFAKKKTCIKMVLNGSPPTPLPSPSPASAKVSCQGANNLEKNRCLMKIYPFYEKIKNFYQGANKGVIS